VADPINKPRAKSTTSLLSRSTSPKSSRSSRHSGQLVACFEYEPTDVLGVLYHRLELHNDRAAVFHAVPGVSVRGQNAVHDAKHLVEEQEFIGTRTLCRQRCHGHCLSSSAREEVSTITVSHVRPLILICLRCRWPTCNAHYAIPALIVHGDTLRAETYSVWRTFAHVMDSGCEAARDPRDCLLLRKTDRLRTRTND